MQENVKKNAGLKYIKGLDSLRAFAVILVVITHWGPHQFKFPALTFIFARIIPNGGLGVDVFFVLSGFLITNILLNARKNAASSARWQIIKSFYLRRMLRIFPIYFLLIFLMLLLADAYLKNNIWYMVTYTSDFLFFKQRDLGEFGPTWSLAVEEQFYLIWPWLIILTPIKYLSGLITGGVIVGSVCSIILYILYGWFALFLPFCCIQGFSIGALLACGQQGMVQQNLLDKIFLLLLGPAVILLAFYQFGAALSSVIRLADSVIAFNIISYTVKQKYNRVSASILNNRVLNYIGKISYGIYLYHFLLPGLTDRVVNYLNGIFKFSKKTVVFLEYPPPAYFIHLCLLLLITTLSYYFFETKITSLKTRFSYITAGRHRAKSPDVKLTN